MTDTPAARPVQSNTPPADPAPPATPPPGTAPPLLAPAAADPLRRSRTSALWVGVIVFAAVLVLLLIFVLQNTQPVLISYLGATGEVPLAVAMLLATAAGILLTAAAGSLRIRQLRRRLPRRRGL